MSPKTMTYVFQAAAAGLGLSAAVSFVLAFRDGRSVIAIIDAMCVVANGGLFYVQTIIRRKLSGL